MLWNKDKLEVVPRYYQDVDDFYIYQNRIYIQYTGISLLQYNMENGRTTVFAEDYSSGAFLGDKFYYIDHAQRTFSIYEQDINTGEISLLRGDGITHFEGGNNMVDQVAVVEGELYYTTRLPCKVYRFESSGEDPLLADFSDDDNLSLLYLSEGNGKLYYRHDEEETQKFYEYDTATQGNTLLAQVEETAHVRSYIVFNQMLLYSVYSNNGYVHYEKKQIPL